MPSFSRGLEQSLHRALEIANKCHHHSAALEHLLLSLADDDDVAAVLRACMVDISVLKTSLIEYVDKELRNLVSDRRDDAMPTIEFSRVIQRAVIRVQSSGHEEVTGAHVLVSLFAEKIVTQFVFLLNRA